MKRMFSLAIAMGAIAGMSFTHAAPASADPTCSTNPAAPEIAWTIEEGGRDFELLRPNVVAKNNAHCDKGLSFWQVTVSHVRLGFFNNTGFVFLSKDTKGWPGPNISAKSTGVCAPGMYFTVGRAAGADQTGTDTTDEVIAGSPIGNCDPEIIVCNPLGCRSPAPE